ncbi:MAG TPA: nuclear transport factor 2 family protein [Solirubrobacteraceae bacterium]|nr:nuclear transport factor 2 family protein [Solirubrobacteraceae bacterium]
MRSITSVGVLTLADGYTALAARDEERLMACLAEDVELRTMTGSYRGHAGVRQWIADMDEGWSSWEVTMDGAREVGDRVLVEATLTARSSVNDIAMSHRFWIVWEVTDGRAARGIHCVDAEEALKEAELGRPATSRRR